MEEEKTKFVKNLKTFSILSGWFTIILGLVVIAGWMFNVSILKSILPSFVSMKANTAAAFMLCGVALLFLRDITFRKKTRLVGRITGVIVSVIGFLTFLECAYNLNFSIDQLLFREDVVAILTASPGRMSANTAISFLLIGLSLFFYDTRIRKSILPGQILSLLAFMISVLCLFGYIFSQWSVLHVLNSTLMALHTAFLFFILSLGILISQPLGGLMKRVTSENTGGIVLRYLIPLIFVFPLVIELLTTSGINLGLYDVSIEHIVNSLLFIVVLSLFSWFAIAKYDRVEIGQKQYEEKFRNVFDNSPVGKSITSIDGSLHVNKSFCDILGYSEEELKLKKWQEITHPDDIQENTDVMQSLVSGEISRSRYEKRYIHKNGNMVWADESTSLQRDLNKQPLFFITSINDITEMKCAKEELQRSKEHLTQAQTMAQLGNWEWDAVKDKITGSEEFFRLFGVSRDQLSRYSQFNNLLYVEDRERVGKEVAESIKSKKTYDTEYRIIMPDGNYKYIHAKGEVYTDDNNNPVQMIGTCQDFTTRKVEEEERERLIAIIEQSSDFIGTSDMKGNLLYHNTAAKKMIGLSEESSMIGMKIEDLCPERFLELVFKEGIPTAIREGKWQSEIALKHIDGHEIPVSHLLMVHKDHAGIPIYTSTVMRDITNLKQTEEALLKLKKAIDNSGEVIFLTDRDGIFTFANPAFTSIYGFTADEIVGKATPRILKSGIIEANDYKLFWETLKSGNEVRNEYINKRKDGTLFNVEGSATPIFDEKNNIIGFLGIQRDITRRKLVEKELIEAKEKAESANKLKDAFIANISHEIRTPLTGILGITSIIRDTFHDNIKEEDEELFEGIDISCKRIIRTVDMILNYSRLQVGEFQIRRKDMKLSPICENLVKEFTIPAKFRSLELTFQNKCGDVNVLADEYSITMAISNLIDNAIKFTNKGLINVILYKGNNDDIILDVKDTGIGINDEYLEKMFEPYQQEQMGYGRAYEGVGLGLSLVKKVLDLNNVKVFVESKKGEGTTFSINFGKEASPVNDKVNTKIMDVIPPSPGNAGIKVVLIVEDDELNQQTIKRFIGDRDTILMTESSEGALEILAREKVDVILMDISIKGKKNGLELTKELKASKEFSQIPVIAVTAHAFDEDRQNALDAGCDNYLSKPFTKESLLEMIAAVCTKL